MIPSPGALLKQANIADTVILAPFAIPGLSELYVSLWAWLDKALFGGNSLTSLNPTAFVFVYLSGAFALLAVYVRSRHSDTRTARMVGLFKVIVAGIFAFAVVYGAAKIFLIPMAADLLVGSLLLVSAHRAP
ncbi:MAG: hypothetical protein AAF221_13575 [Pseudomonadota bacterium]